MRIFIVTVFLFVMGTPFFSKGQTMNSIFQLLPSECTPELNSKQKDTLLKNREYIIPDGDTIETVKYELDISEANQYLRYEYYYTTGQRGFISFEVRKFKKIDGSSLILFSSYSGALRAFDQTEIYAFKYQDNKLIKTTIPMLPKKLDANIFLNKSTPDSIRKQVYLYSSCSYDLSPELKDSIAYRIFFEIVNDKNESYLLGDTVFFTWTGQSFLQGKVTTSE